jgi:hypothetical protein
MNNDVRTLHSLIIGLSGFDCPGRANSDRRHCAAKSPRNSGDWRPVPQRWSRLTRRLHATVKIHYSRPPQFAWRHQRECVLARQIVPGCCSQGAAASNHFRRLSDASAESHSRRINCISNFFSIRYAYYRKCRVFKCYLGISLAYHIILLAVVAPSLGAISRPIRCTAQPCTRILSEDLASWPPAQLSIVHNITTAGPILQSTNNTSLLQRLGLRTALETIRFSA